MTSVKMPDELEQARAELERDRIALERARIKLERQRLEMERQTFEVNRVTKRKRVIAQEHLGTFITTVIALATIIVSLTQVWVANISKSTELEITRQQQEREWRYKGLELRDEKRDVFFGQNSERREHLANALAVAFPPEIAASLLNNLKQTADTLEQRNTYALTEDKMHGKNPLMRHH